ncbi:tetratricopeptide repeat protein [Phocaeicola sp.]|uniref:tetratricopeptide repeat protein n=1 Tax=Phocaeicola sp. TaxID=2773926 RepID=UPI0023CEF9A5|nr:tetratricopeptide repeat protein [Phocaeicola sp.]MDE5677762.1 tetratricopeptide repeat protein [Phocaeicola sp.]
MYEEIIKLLEEHRLKEALGQMTKYAARTSNWQLKTEIESLQTSYDLMLQYTSKGMKDPNKVEMYHKMLCTAYELNDQTYTTIQAENSHEVYYNMMRAFAKTPPHSYAKLQMQLETYTEDIATALLAHTGLNIKDGEIDNIRKRHEAAIDELFEKIWVSTRWNEMEYKEMEALFQSPLIQVNDLCIIISAITMSLIQIFDIRKFMFLLKAYTHHETVINQRAIVGIALTCYYHEKRILLYTEATAYIKKLNETSKFAQNLYDIQIQLLTSSRETRKIDKKMREEILPEMIKNTKFNLKGTDEESEDQNPEWRAWIDHTEVNDKLREMSELQISGADVYMSTFSQLKQFSFFRKISHWFYPFDTQNQHVASLFLENNKLQTSILDILMNSDTFCNSDKYSFCLTILEVSGDRRELIYQHLNIHEEATEELRDHIKNAMMSEDRSEFVSRQYIHDLYRFFKLWSNRHEIHDIFEDTLDLWNKKTISKTLLHKDYINQLADYLFIHDNLTEAQILYNKSIKLYNRQSAELWQKAGFIYQKTGDYQKAIEYYLQSDLLAPDNIWNNRHLAQCYKKKGNYSKALEHYKKVEQVQPDHLNLALQIGQCLMALEQYNEALTYFFKVEYLDKKPLNARRAIGWCSFITGNYQQAQKYYDLLIAEPKPIMEDWMNAGHVYHILGEMEKSITYYRKARELCDSHNEFIRNYHKDKKDLIKQGLSEVDLFILPDELI